MIHPIFIAMPTDTTIWLIEDEAAIADTLIYALQTEGYAVRWFERGQLMLDALAPEPWGQAFVIGHGTIPLQNRTP